MLPNMWSLLPPEIIAIVTSIIVSVATHVPFVMNALRHPQPTPPAAQIESAGLSEVAPMQAKDEPEATPVFASSTVAIGNYTITTGCKGGEPQIIEIKKNNLASQLLKIQRNTGTGMNACPEVDVRDFNFDGHPDFSIVIGTGSGGGSYQYWLFRPQTGEFSCGGEEGCVLGRYRLYPQQKLVATSHSLGVGSRVVTVYGVKDGNLESLTGTTENVLAGEPMSFAGRILEYVTVNEVPMMKIQIRSDWKKEVTGTILVDSRKADIHLKSVELNHFYAFIAEPDPDVLGIYRAKTISVWNSGYPI